MTAPPRERRSPGTKSRATSTPPSADFDTTANYRSCGIGSIGSVELIKSSRTRTRVEACERLGLEYWADHPQRSCVWATGPDREFHVVQLPTKRTPAAVHVAGVCCTTDTLTPITDWKYPA